MDPTAGGRAIIPGRSRKIANDSRIHLSGQPVICPFLFHVRRDGGGCHGIRGAVTFGSLPRPQRNSAQSIINTLCIYLQAHRRTFGVTAVTAVNRAGKSGKAVSFGKSDGLSISDELLLVFFFLSSFTTLVESV